VNYLYNKNLFRHTVSAFFELYFYLRFLNQGELNINNENQKINFKYNHSEVFGGIIFIIVVFAAMAAASHFIN